MATGKEHISILKSAYVIDGVHLEATPADMLDSACGKIPSHEGGKYEAIVDESIDPAPRSGEPDPLRYEEYLSKVNGMAAGEAPLYNTASYTKFRLAGALIDSIWRKGHFRLGDLAVSAAWRWDPKPVGSMAAFYNSVEAACDYLDGLGITMRSYSARSAETSGIDFKAALSDQPEIQEDEADIAPSPDQDYFFPELPFSTEKHIMSRGRKCPGIATGRPGDWIIYIPFDTCPPVLGGSTFARATNLSCGNAPEIGDTDYFIDCYEVVRELVEDGIVKAGVTIGDGGLIAALKRMVPQGSGINAEVGGIMKAYGNASFTGVLFAETPGVVIDIPDDDYDYIDAELLLQDVAYYPLGHISPELEGIKASASDNSDIIYILNSLIGGPASEGED